MILLVHHSASAGKSASHFSALIPLGLIDTTVIQADGSRLPVENQLELKRLARAEEFRRRVLAGGRQTMRMADRHGLLKTGGSDFHGTNKKDIRLGTANGRRVPREFMDALLARL